MTEPFPGRKLGLAPLMRLLWAAALALPAFGAQAGVVFANLHSFVGANDGANPSAGLVQGSDGNFYGTTSGGGASDSGTVFQISTNGTLTSLHSFGSGNDGAFPNAGLVQGSDGSFYGTTTYGGTNGGNGTVFRITARGTLTTLYSFTGGNDGWGSHAGLVQGGDSNFYGTTDAGGTNGAGTLFRISTNGVLTSLYSFQGGFIVPNPVAGLVQGSGGNFYGTTYQEGVSGDGTVFEITTSGAVTTLYSFTGGSDGAGPVAGLVQGSDGNFYGTTSSGGTNGGYGTVFRISTNGAPTSLHSFTGGNDGASPVAALVEGSDGNFYGTTTTGGTNGFGTVFRISPHGVLSNLHSFTGGKDGANPEAALVQGSDGNFYGTTSSGGTNNLGTVFRVTTSTEPPQLTILPSAANVILTWPTNTTDFHVGCATNLVAPIFWNTNSPVPVVVNGQYTVTNPISGTQQFFRLSQ